MTRTKTLLVTLVAVLLVLTGEAVAANKIDQSFDLPARYAATIETTDCNASPGPRVTLGGNVSLAALGVDVVFSHVMGAPDPQSSVAVRREVVPGDEPTAVPQQSIVGAIGGNPFLWLQLTDPKGRPLTSEVFLGRCEQGQFSPTVEMALPAKAIADVSATDCDASAGPVVALNGQVELSPLHGKVIFRSSDTVGGPGPRRAEAAIELVILPTGSTFQFPQEAVQAGTGGNPLISAQFRVGEGATIGTEARLGRCSAITTK